MWSLPVREQIEEIRQKIAPILKQHGVIRAGLFGSFVKEEVNEESDIDILVELEADESLLAFIALKLELEDTLGRPVDLVEYPMLHPRLSKQILQEEVQIL